ncbi:membrane fusion protein, multidrug efflux system [Cnuella takakiae]|uniref:Membrane fusion protein, multidrug efflux system n=1 Tax=Cnuella takakiae TaxID=1302690 RepID=A0A1M5GDH1_9BACT|nr:efflux RND transporter periplasmic adaptor subunit [Cnuella takakiae]SHG01541.1 membrane fusion protein, multidrug efflux system [Cnuella takakiae]
MFQAVDLQSISRTSLIALSSAVLLAACSSDLKEKVTAQQKQGPRPPAKVDAFVVNTTTVSEALEVPGNLVADEATEIHPEVSGRVTGLYIREGAYVNKGALLAKLYDGDLQAQRKKLEVQLKIAQTTEDRYNQLVQIGGISKQDYDLTSLNVSNLRADLDIIRTAIQKTEVRAPFSGKLGLKEISTGAYVTPTSVITSIQKTAGLRIDFNVPEKYTTQIKKGQNITFTVEGNDRTYNAAVMATESGIAEETRSLTVRAQVKGDATGLLPGGFAKVKLAFEPDANALMIPTQSVVPQARGKKVYVYRGGVAQFVEVTTGVRDSSKVQVLEGLKQGDTVITTGLLGLKPDAKVTIGKVQQ